LDQGSAIKSFLGSPGARFQKKPRSKDPPLLERSRNGCASGGRASCSVAVGVTKAPLEIGLLAEISHKNMASRRGLRFYGSWTALTLSEVQRTARRRRRGDALT